MAYWDYIWIICFFTLWPLTLAGMVIVHFWFKQLERTYPHIFGFGNLPSTDWRKTNYWGFILSGKSATLDRPDMRAKCAILRAFFWIYLVNFLLVAIGVVAPHAGLAS